MPFLKCFPCKVLVRFIGHRPPVSPFDGKGHIDSQLQFPRSSESPSKLEQFNASVRILPGIHCSFLTSDGGTEVREGINRTLWYSQRRKDLSSSVTKGPICPFIINEDPAPTQAQHVHESCWIWSMLELPTWNSVLGCKEERALHNCQLLLPILLTITCVLFNFRH